ncbi:EXLDI protein [Corynebacterium sp. sy017]|nr:MULTISPECIES: EXLDI protein [unclassified Corynebacterium]MBP3089373.1 EXLDI protein [Corynebacterium sp. sy017]QDZ43303.1 EXLDI protein [Corynebacterium sp. sy039]TSD90934.1 EXLDI protein [Corynebacterium sp. SY003]
MPTKNIYVSEADMQLFEEAAQHAESVSAAVIQALQDYVSDRRHAAKGYEKIELTLHENGVRRKVMFHGLEITRVERPVEEGIQIDTIYETAKGQLAVATKTRKVLPDWVKESSRIWDNPQTWSRDFWVVGDKVLAVYPDIASLQSVDEYLAERCESALSAKPFEVLDI